MLEIMKIGDTEIPIQSLRRRYKELLAQDPNTESSKMESEFAVSRSSAYIRSYCMLGCKWSIYISHKWD
jgi:hypothetical protein